MAFFEPFVEELLDFLLKRLEEAGFRIAAVTGTLMLVLMWAAELPLANNPFMDEHVIYAVVLVGLALANAGATLGLGNLPSVRRAAWLK